LIAASNARFARSRRITENCREDREPLESDEHCRVALQRFAVRTR
jgi:hypothetical protein